MNPPGAVVIGRNEGERLRRCLESLAGQAQPIVYVDSGSTDGSTAMAKALDVEVIELDASLPFTAARARNAGFARLQEICPDCETVMFVDGDCEVAPAWLACACAAMESNAGVALVCGRRVERFPEASIYNRLCDLEWDGPAGETPACGGDALIRAKALARSGGYNPDVIAGEEPELCVRLRQAGWKILRIAETMTIHDAAMTRFSQWWKRSFRAGHAYAEGAARHGRSAQRHFVREYRSNWSWGLALPLAVAVAAPLSHGWSLAALALYPLLFLRIAYRRHRMLQTPWRHAVLYAAACVVGKFPQVLGQLRYWVSRWRGKRTRLIEYKSSAKPTHEHGQHVAAG